MSIGVIGALFMLSLLSGFVPQLTPIMEPFKNDMNKIKNQTSTITDKMSEQSQGVNINPDPISSLASALGGIAILTLNIGNLLLNVLIELPFTFISIFFGITEGIGGEVLEGEAEGHFTTLTDMLQSIVLIVITITIVVGIVFHIILGRPPILTS